MAQPYLEKRVKEALATAQGNKIKARKLLVTWATQDAELLLHLVKSHLPAIAAATLEGTMRTIEKRTIPPKRKAEPPKEKFGQTLLNAMSDTGAATFGLEDSGAPIGKRKASAAHVEAIHKLAKPAASNPVGRKS